MLAPHGLRNSRTIARPRPDASLVILVRMGKAAEGSKSYLEVEIKLLVRDLSAISAQLQTLGARRQQRVFEQNTIYDTPEADFRRYGRLIRLRVETPARGPKRALMTAKAPPQASAPRTLSSRRVRRRPQYKERLEREVVVSNPARAERFLRAVGIRPVFRYEKYRTQFELPGLHIALDETPAGVFVELEGSPRPIDRVARALGYTPRDYFRGTYWDVYAALCRQKRHKPWNMLFPREKL